MATRSKAPMRRERESDSMESLKPIVVLVLLGMAALELLFLDI